MRARLRTAGWAAVAIAGLSALFYLLLRGLWAASLQPVYQDLVRLYAGLPAALVWLAVVALFYLIAVTGWLRLAGDWLLTYYQARSERQALAEHPEGRVMVLTRWVNRRHRGLFSRHYLKTLLAELAIAQLAQTRRVSPPQIRAALAAGTLGLPPEINAYLLDGLSPWPAETLSGLRALAARLGLKAWAMPPDAEFERVLQFLEEQ